MVYHLQDYLATQRSQSVAPMSQLETDLNMVSWPEAERVACDKDYRLVFLK